MKTINIAVKLLLWMPILVICLLGIGVSTIFFRIFSIFGKPLKWFLDDLKRMLLGTEYERIIDKIFNQEDEI